MKKKSIVNLIKYYTEKNDNAFRNEAYEIAQDFSLSGDNDLAQYVISLLTNANTFSPQDISYNLQYLQKVPISTSPLPLPNEIFDDIIGITNAISKHNVHSNKFLFQGAPGTGKTESAKQIARMLNRELYKVNMELAIDSKLGQTSKNISELFNEINHIPYSNEKIFLFDEIDALVLNRVDSNDVREIGRATTSFFKELDNINENITIIATTNLYSMLDTALIRRFDAVIDFNRYTQKDLVDIADSILDEYLSSSPELKRDKKLFNKILSQSNLLPYPGTLKNMIKTSISFSDPSDETDYLRKIYKSVIGTMPDNIKVLSDQGFTLREIEILTKIPKTTVSRTIKDN